MTHLRKLPSMSSPLRHYAVVMRDSRFCLHGPFPSEDAMSHWANDGSDPASLDLSSPNNPDGDPRWQSIELTDAQASAPLLIRGPDEPMWPTSDIGTEV